VKKLLLVAAALAALAPLAAANALAPEAARAPEGTRAAEAVRVVVCHRTTSRARPYQRVVVTTSAALRQHQRHPADIVPAVGACPRTLLTATSGGTALTGALLGVAERPEPGDADGGGTATIRIRRNQGQVCFRYTVRDVETITAAHIHRGNATVAGPVIVTLRPPNATGVASGCVAANRALVNQIRLNRGSFYVNVHNADFPGGAIRAQLGPTTTVRFFVTEMTGQNEIPPADANGRGTSQVRMETGSTQVCFTLAVRNIQLPATGAHIHRGTATQNGPVVVGFTPVPDAAGVARGCVTATAELVSEILANPSGFYVNVHSRQFPGGAVRGQLG